MEKLNENIQEPEPLGERPHCSPLSSTPVLLPSCRCRIVWSFTVLEGRSYSCSYSCKVVTDVTTIVRSHIQHEMEITASNNRGFRHAGNICGGRRETFQPLVSIWSVSNQNRYQRPGWFPARSCHVLTRRWICFALKN